MMHLWAAVCIPHANLHYLTLHEEIQSCHGPLAGPGQECANAYGRVYVRVVMYKAGLEMQAFQNTAHHVVTTGTAVVN